MRYHPLLLSGIGRQIADDFADNGRYYSPVGCFNFVFEYYDLNGRQYARPYPDVEFHIGDEHGSDDLMPFLFETSLKYKVDTVYRVVNSPGEELTGIHVLYGYHFNLVPLNSSRGVELTSDDIENINRVVVEKMRDTDSEGSSHG